MGRQKTIFEQLEPRILLSGSPLPVEEPSAIIVDVAAQEASKESLMVSEVLFIDANVEDYEHLISNLQRNVEIVLINENENGIHTINSHLSSHDDISAIHIISHGGDGFLQLGNERLDIYNLNSTSSWNNALTDNGNIFLYGCNVAQTEIGKAFIDQFSNLTQTNVAASTDATGSEEKGGDWDLEYNNSSDQVLSFEDYMELLIANDTTDFVITATTNGANESFTFYTNDLNYNIDWDNDGTEDSSNVSGDQTHVFATAGTHTIRFSNLTDISINNNADRDKYTSIEQWGNLTWDAQMNNAFYGASNLVVNASDTPDMSNVNNMKNMFFGASKFNSDISNWNTSKVTNMESMFRGATLFNQNISGWDTSKVTNMISMFRAASDFNQNIGSWDTSKVTDMKNMFFQASKFNGNIGTWNVGNVTDMESIFRDASNFNQDIGNWDVSKVDNMISMLRNLNLFNHDIGNWDVSNVTTMKNMFNNSDVFNQDIGNWDVSKVTDMDSMFRDMSFNQDISAWDTGEVTTTLAMFRGNQAFNQDISAWDISKVTTMQNIFVSASSFSVENYDKLLDSTTGWSSQTLKTGVSFGAPNFYTDAVGHAALAAKGWNITGDALLNRMTHTATPILTEATNSPVLFTSNDYDITDGTANEVKQTIFEVTNFANNASETINYNGLNISLINNNSVSDGNGNATVNVNGTTATVTYNYSTKQLSATVETDLKSATYTYADSTSDKSIRVTVNDEFGALTSKILLVTIDVPEIVAPTPTETYVKPSVDKTNKATLAENSPEIGRSIKLTPTPENNPPIDSSIERLYENDQSVGKPQNLSSQELDQKLPTPVPLDTYETPLLAPELLEFLQKENLIESQKALDTDFKQEKKAPQPDLLKDLSNQDPTQKNEIEDKEDTDEEKGFDATSLDINEPIQIKEATLTQTDLDNFVGLEELLVSEFNCLA